MPQELHEQVPVMKQVLHAMGIPDGWSSPDWKRTTFWDACKARGKRGDGCIPGFRDRDLLQIASDKIKIRIPKTKGARTEVEDYYAADVEAKYGVTPAGFIELKALMGRYGGQYPRRAQGR